MRHFLSAIVVMAWVPAAASAQPADATLMRVSLNGGVEAANRTGTQHFSFEKNLETANVTTTSAVKNAPLIDASLTVLVAKGFAFGVAVSSATFQTTAQILAQIPHPFFFNQPRSVEGPSRVTRTETAVHFEPTFIANASQVEVAVFGGPTLFHVGQDLITDVTYSDTYPFDTTAFVSAATTRVDKYAVGYNVGVDVTWKFSRRVGAGGLLRYSVATTTLGSGTASASIEAGGLQAGGGIRIRF